MRRLLKLVNLAREALRPLWRFLPGSFRRRLQFEEQNADDPACVPFPPQEKVSCAFEVSSVGELEQVRPLLESLLAGGEKLELIYCSPSVEEHCQKLYKDWPAQIRLLRLPVLSMRPPLADWSRADRLVLCRYDFFPELLLFPGRLFLISAKPQKKYRPLYHFFSKIICAGEKEREALLALGLPPERSRIFDFRHCSILRRLEKGAAALDEKLVTWISRSPRSQRLIVGSAWPAEMEIFAGDLQNMRVVVVPHRTDALSVGHLEGAVRRVSPETRVARFGEEGWESSEGILIVPRSGILLELYTLFGHALVGGGHGRSVHSLLEPFWAGAQVYCGPRVLRSTEYTFIRHHSPHSVVIVPELKHMAEALTSSGPLPTSELKERMQAGLEEHRRWLLG